MLRSHACALAIAALLGVGCVRGGFERRAFSPSVDRSSGETARREAGSADASPGRDGPREASAQDTSHATDLALPADLPGPDLAPCAAAELAVSQELAAINHCGDASDCTYSPGICPFGCYILHHVSESTTKLNPLMGYYKFTLMCDLCDYMCAPAGTLVCELGKCKMVF